jgi:trk system potassium uptake protein
LLLNLRAVIGVLGALLGALGVSLLAPMGVALVYGEALWWTFAVTALASMAGGGAAWWFFRPRHELRVREGFAIVALSWIVLSLVGALPFWLSGTLSYTDGFFETVSGFTTTGATILGGTRTPAIEATPMALLFWRSLSHWLGGMGIIVLTLAILPLLGIGGMQLFKAEVSGPQADKLTPRVRETAKRLWLIYFGLTVIQTAMLWPAMGIFDAVNHAFATMATGGFSTKNASVAHFQSAYVDWVITAFMLLAGVNFALHYHLLHGRLRVLRSEELRAYLGVMLLATVLYRPGAGVLPGPHGDQPPTATAYDSALDAARIAAFQAVSIVTTTGFGTDDYERWPALALGVVFMLFFTGGMAGSTAGGIKMIRHVLLVKNSYRELNQLLHPQAVFPLRMDHRVVPADVLRNVLSFIVLYLLLILFGTLVMAMLGFDLLSAFGAAASCVGNIGPAFGAFGPVETYAEVPAVGKWVLSFLMVAGRLEIFTLLVLLAPGFWRR